ncbi:kelch 10 [Solea senegalensis]|uniref:Kelch 10 n=1 Tax=Solea senegalensis TaxID=28829 RepID=A0AAV6SNV6_SOLSE|nr:kelch 10 [Solea senegalensis]
MEGLYHNAVLRVKEVEFKTHTIILRRCSPYFRALFKYQSTSDNMVFDISDLSPNSMQLILEFAYTGSVNVRKDNVEELIIAADMLNVMAVVQACADFISEQLCPENCIGIWRLTNVVNCDLQQKAHRYITCHFEQVYLCDEFLQLSVQELVGILDRDELNVKMEFIVFKAVSHWISHKPEEREKHIALLLSKVRLALTSMRCIYVDVMSNELVMNNTACQKMASDAIKTIQYKIRQKPSVFGFRNVFARPRLPNAILLAIGGWRGSSPVSDIEAFDVCAGRWFKVVHNLDRPRAYHGTAFLDGYLYCIGGIDQMERFNTVCRMHLRTQTWQEVSSMYYGRCYVCTTVLNGCIYALGGFDGYFRLHSAECYAPKTNQWKCIAEMHFSRSDASCTTLHNKIYVCGGYDGHGSLETAECYNSETNQWTMIAPMNSKRTGLGVIAHADLVYAIGGCQSSIRHSSAEAYNPQTNTWNVMSSMSTPRSSFGLGVINEQIYVVGGFTGPRVSNKVECYDKDLDRWSLACGIKRFRTALSCCVVYGIPNIADFIVPRDSLPLIHLDDRAVVS